MSSFDDNFAKKRARIELALTYVVFSTHVPNKGKTAGLCAGNKGNTKNTALFFHCYMVFNEHGPEISSFHKIFH